MVQTLCCLDLSIDSDLMLRALGELAHGLLGNFLAQLLSCHRRTETTHMHQYVSFLHWLKGSNTYCRLLLQLLLLIEPSARSFPNRKKQRCEKKVKRKKQHEDPPPSMPSHVQKGKLGECVVCCLEDKQDGCGLAMA